MKNLIKLSTTIALPLIILNPLNSQAQGLFTGEWGVGIEIENDAQHYKDFDNDAYVNLFPQYRGEKLNIDSDSLSYSLLESDKYNFEILAKSLYYGYEAKDSTLLKGMAERDGSIEFGGRASLKTDYGLLSLHALTDVLGNHKGQEVELRFGQPFYTEQWTGQRDVSLGLIGGLRWQSKKMIDYYYGVESSEATATRKEYQGHSAFIPFAGVEVKARFSEHFSFKGGLMYEKLPGTITNSPITSDSGNEIRANLGLSYWF